MSQIETEDGIRPSQAKRDRRDAINMADILAKAGVAPELGNLIQIAASAINLIARDPIVGAAPALTPILSSASVALQRAGVIVRKAIPGAERSSAQVGCESLSCHECPKASCHLKSLRL
jgi:hypothetical protein